MSSKFFQYFQKFNKHRTDMSLVGMVHVKALPGTPSYKNLSVQQLVDQACREALIYLDNGLDGICLENMFDVPYVKKASPEITAIMTRVCSEVRRICPKPFPLGVQVLAGLNKEAIAVALASDLQFVRVEGFLFSHIADEGWIDACAGPLLRYRKMINAEHIAILADIKKKHCSHSITSDVSVADTAKAAHFFQADGIILTGKETGDFPELNQIALIKSSLTENSLPIIVGSGVTDKNLESLIDLNVNAAIIGSHFKRNGNWLEDVCPERVSKFMEQFHRIISKKS